MVAWNDAYAGLRTSRTIWTRLILPQVGRKLLLFQRLRQVIDGARELIEACIVLSYLMFRDGMAVCRTEGEIVEASHPTEGAQQTPHAIKIAGPDALCIVAEPIGPSGYRYFVKVCGKVGKWKEWKGDQGQQEVPYGHIHTV